MSETTTAVATDRKRLGDGQTFFSSHAACYKLGLHAKTAAGRESCRTGMGIKQSADSRLPRCAHSQDSKTTHLLTDDDLLVCTGKPVNELWHIVRTDVTCKNCVKHSA